MKDDEAAGVLDVATVPFALVALCVPRMSGTAQTVWRTVCCV